MGCGWFRAGRFGRGFGRRRFGDFRRGSMSSGVVEMRPGSSGVARAAWVVVGLLWPVALLNYLDRQMLASMKYSVMGDVPTIGSEENWGFMLGQFKWVYASLSPIGGYVADRFSRRFVICGSLFVWSA